MNSRGSWSVEEIKPSAREEAEAAARRAGMSLHEWLNSAIGDTAQTSPPSQISSRASVPETREVAEIHQRLDTIAHQIEQISRPTDRERPPVATQLNEAISRLDARLAKITGPAAPPQDAPPAGGHERGAARNPNTPSHALSVLDNAVAEILARQHELDHETAPAIPPRQAPPIAPVTTAPAAGPDMAGFERELSKITSQIEAMHPAQIEQSIAALRDELAEIRRAITEAMPRQAIESIEHEVRVLVQRIDAGRQGGQDDQALAGVERALDDIRETLRTLTPAEKLAGFDEAIRGLGARLDTIMRSSDNPAALQQLEGTVASLRAITANIASNDALAQLGDQVHALSSKVDQLAHGGYGESLTALERHIVSLTSALESRTLPAAEPNSGQLEGAVRALSERLDRMPVGNDAPSALAHLEQRVTFLLERLESATDHRSSALGRVEDGLQEVLRHLERQQTNIAGMVGRAGSADASPDIPTIDALKRELSDIRLSQSETDRHTQDSLEAVHNTLGHVVDRLAAIEGDLRNTRTAQPADASQAGAPRMAMPPRPELPNPAQMRAAAPQPSGDDTPPSMPTTRPLNDFLVSREPPAPAPATVATPPLASRATAPQVTVSRDLPPDTPLEPGTPPPNRKLSPSERIAASESAISDIPPAAPVQAGSSSFIAAARRAAQAAAAAAPSADKPGHGAETTKSLRAMAKNSGISSKIRSLLVGASVVAIVLGSVKMAMTLLDGASIGTHKPTAAQSSAAAGGATRNKPVTSMPLITSPTPIDRQSANPPASDSAAAASSEAGDEDDTTGAISPVAASETTPPAASSDASPAPVSTSETLPEAIGGPQLRAAALKGDPAAAYEVALRFAEGKGTAVNFDEAAKWYARSAQSGIVPAMFRLGTFYEKGLGVKKNVDTARHYYLMAAERGNAKAMHNLAVLDADGGGKGADYKSAALWFRKAAERGVTDSQFNLGILYARGIGVQQNLSESYKWFSLAAAHGDPDSGRKRDDVAKQLDAQSLAAAKLAVTAFKLEPQPDDAINVATPAGGWDASPAAKSASVKPAHTGRASSARASR